MPLALPTCPLSLWLDWGQGVGGALLPLDSESISVLVFSSSLAFS